MGDVYQATDTKLGRCVAVKVLPDAFARDAERLSRFEREAKVLASLNHPNIAALYGMEEAEGRHFLVMELVPGETLAQRLQRGSIPVGEVLKIAHQIAEGVEAAHDKGVVHRDLKPANVKITPESRVKVLDFGLAKAMDNNSATADLSSSPTLTMAATNAGIILGTAAYMSPEQANGLPLNTRSDVFSFGSVLYEMLTGRQAFQGRTISEIIASVLVREPDWTSMPSNLNPRIHELVRRCLEKDAKNRWQAIGDVRVELERLLADPNGWLWSPQSLVKERRLRRLTSSVLIAAIVAGIVGGVTVWNLKPSAPGSVMRFSLTLPEDQVITTANRQSIAISPDGSRLVYVANRQLYLRSMSEMEARPIPGAADFSGIGGPFFSPDGQSIGFYSGSDVALKKISVSGGPSIEICKVRTALGGNWDGDHIVFGDVGKGIVRVSAKGGEPEILVSIKEEEGLAFGPQLIDDGRAVLFTLAPPGTAGFVAWDRAQIVVQRLPSGQRKVVVPAGTDGRYLPSGHILYAQGEDIFALPFNVKTLEPETGAVSIVEGVTRASGPMGAAANLSFSLNGTLAYIPDRAQTTTQRNIAFVDRSGKTQMLPLPAGPYRSPRISPDGKQLAFETFDKNQIWLYDLSSQSVARPLTFEGHNFAPIWMPDGRSLIFQSDREGATTLYRQVADGSKPPERLLQPERGAVYVPFSVHPSGKFLAYGRSNAGLIRAVDFLSLSQNQTIEALREVSANATFSRDGAWLSYTYRLGERPQIFVRPFPGLTATKYQIAEEGNFSLWSPDGKQLFYNRAPNNFFAVDIRTEPSFASGKPVQLPIPGILYDPNGPRPFDITPDGRFVVVIPASQTDTNPQRTSQINLVLNWFVELKQRVPAR